MSKGVLASEILRGRELEKLRPPRWIGGEKLLQLVTCIGDLSGFPDHRHQTCQELRSRPKKNVGVMERPDCSPALRSSCASSSRPQRSPEATGEQRLA